MIKKLFRNSIVCGVALLLAAGLIGFGGVNSARAALEIISEDYRAEVVMTNIHTVLLENGTETEGKDALCQSLVPEGEKFKVGKAYDEVLAVRNVKKDEGTIPQNVRVTVYRYWEDGNGKRIDLDPELIDLHFVTDGGWSIEPGSTAERTVLYYSDTLDPDDVSSEFADKLTIKPEVFNAVTKLAGESEEHFAYEDVTFKVKVIVDAVQTHNEQDAMMGAWGRTK